MRKYGKDVQSLDAWNQMAHGYAHHLQNDYHRHRLAVIQSLIPEELYQPGKSILDFGCGDAVHFEPFLRKGCRISGLDISAEMIALAKKRLAQMNLDSDVVSVGGAQHLTGLEENSLDAILSFNVLAYLTNNEEALFYKEAFRLLRPGGYLIVTHSNELFDLYSLNQYTVEFFGRHFVSEGNTQSSVAKLIANTSGAINPTTYNVRENPLIYRYKLRRHGFVEKRQEFINLHTAPPPLLSNAKTYPDTLSYSEEDKWKLMFMCSTYGSLSIRTDQGTA